MMTTPIDDILRDESEHRFGNLMQMLASNLDHQARAACAPQIRVALSAAAAQVVAVGKLQRALSRPLQRRNTNWAEDLQRICNLLEQTMLAPQGHVLIFSSQGSSDQPAPCHQIIQHLILIMTEFVINAAKHAFPADGVGTVNVSLSQTASGVTCCVADNGVGRFQTETGSNSRGMALVSQIAERVGGQCEWAFSLRGSRAAVSFPYRQLTTSS